eukprot:scaffold459792_cov16-Prasinocladus_malaysianus.AAC.1
MQNPDMRSCRQSRLWISAATVRLALSAADFPSAKSYAAVSVRLYQNQTVSNRTEYQINIHICWDNIPYSLTIPKDTLQASADSAQNMHFLLSSQLARAKINLDERHR